MPESKCVKACKLDKETNACAACGRTKQEIAEYGKLYLECIKRGYYVRNQDQL